MTQTPDIWMLHTTNPREGESAWGGCYIVEADAHNDAATMRKVTGLDWSVVPMVRTDSIGKCLHQIAEPAEDIWPCINLDVDEHGAVTNAKLYTPGLPAGNHDVYPVRVPYMDEHTEAWLTCVKELEKFDPTFLNREGMNGIECAASLIRELVGRAQDAARWREAIKTVGAESHISGSRYVIRGLEAPANVMRGSVAEHFTKSIDTALAAQAKQGGA